MPRQDPDVAPVQVKGLRRSAGAGGAAGGVIVAVATEPSLPPLGQHEGRVERPGLKGMRERLQVAAELRHLTHAKPAGRPG